MKVSIEDIRNILKGAKGEGHEAGLRDVAFALLARTFEEPVYAFRAIFGDHPDVPFIEYNNCEKKAFLADIIETLFPEEQQKENEDKEDEDTNDDTPADGGMSYNEIKRGLEEDLKSLIELRDGKDEDGNPTLEPKEMAAVVGRIADIRVKLTEKFGTTRKVEQQRVIVTQKFDEICWKCGAEIAMDPRLKRRLL